jgi:hypothetical protein
MDKELSVGPIVEGIKIFLNAMSLFFVNQQKVT